MENLQETFQEERALKPVLGASPLGTLKVHPTKRRSSLAMSLGGRMARVHGQHCHVHWGCDGFCIDVALRDPSRPGEIPLGLLCDFSRFDQAGDPVEWDLYRTAMMEAQGWNIHRVWSPGLFLDPIRQERAICQVLQAIRR